MSETMTYIPDLIEVKSKLITRLSALKAEREDVVFLMHETWPSSRGGAEAQLSDMIDVAEFAAASDAVPSLPTIGRWRRREGRGPDADMRAIVFAAAKYAETRRRNEATARLRKRRYEWFD